MTAMSTTTQLPPVSPPLNAYLRRFTVDEYHRLTEIGVLTEEDHVELVEGWIVLKMARNPPHDCALDATNDALRATLSALWRVRVQSAITLDDSEPELDLAVVLGPAVRYRDHHPGPSEIGLIVEVADSTLAWDRGEKARTYARASISCYWIVNLVDRQLEVNSDPTGPIPTPAYRQRQDLRPGESVPLVLGGQTVATLAVEDLIP